MKSTLKASDTIFHMTEAICKNAQRATNNTRLIMQGGENVMPFIEGVDTTGMMFTKAGGILYATKCPPGMLI